MLSLVYCAVRARIPSPKQLAAPGNQLPLCPLQFLPCAKYATAGFANAFEVAFPLVQVNYVDKPAPPPIYPFVHILRTLFTLIGIAIPSLSQIGIATLGGGNVMTVPALHEGAAQILE